ncbi:MAG: PQQ-binding-like beta-propeller repeat protein [Deltaproteobacteria bacterium]|nr:PQQ-binding-like beta-propeller repeat protein [Deltaproteobacteria bacterium]
MGWFFFAVTFAVAALGSCSTDGSDAGGGPSPSADANWWLFGHDYHNTRANTAETTIGVDNVGELELLWERVTVQSTSTPAVVDDIVYYADWSGMLYAKNTADGSEVWTAELEGGTTASPAVTEDKVFIGGGGAVLFCVDRETGDVIWSADVEDHPQAGLTGSAIPIDDMVIIGVSSGEVGNTDPEYDYTFRGSIVALDQTSGDELWRVYVAEIEDPETQEVSGAGVSVWSTAAIDVDRQMMFIGTGQAYEVPAGPRSDSVIAIDYTNGEVVWVRQFTADDVYSLFQTPPQGPDADIGAAPNLFRIGGQDVVGVGDKGGVYAVLDRDTGEEVWAHILGPGSHLGGVMTAAAYADGRIFLAQNAFPRGFDTENVFIPDFNLPENTSDVIALDATTGDEIWRVPVESPSIGGFQYANGVVYAAHTLGKLRAFNAENGDVLWTEQVGFSQASGTTVSNGRLFVTHGFQFIRIVMAPPGMEGGIQVYGLK